MSAEKERCARCVTAKLGEHDLWQHGPEHAIGHGVHESNRYNQPELAPQRRRRDVGLGHVEGGAQAPLKTHWHYRDSLRAHLFVSQ